MERQNYMSNLKERPMSRHGMIFAVLATILLMNLFLSDAFASFAYANSNVKTGGALGAVRELGDDTFEHDTQAATGATTGDWLILFYVPGNAKSSSVAQVFEKVAASMPRKVMFGAVDVQANSRISHRFRLTTVPSLIMFSKGKMYRFLEEPTVLSLTSFATGDFKKAKEAEDIPAEITLLEQYFTLIKKTCSKSWDIYRVYPDAAIVLLALGILLGIFLTLAMCSICCKKGGGLSSASRRSKSRKKD